MQLLTTSDTGLTGVMSFPPPSAGAAIWVWRCDLNSFNGLIAIYMAQLREEVTAESAGSGRRGFASLILDATKHSRRKRMHRNAGVQLT